MRRMDTFSVDYALHTVNSAMIVCGYILNALTFQGQRGWHVWFGRSNRFIVEASSKTDHTGNVSKSILNHIFILVLCLLSVFPIPLGGDKVSMLTHTYPYKPLRKIKVTICNRQTDSPLYVWPDV